jgi:hypothetical protein
VSASLVRGFFFFGLVKSESSCLETTLLSSGLSEFHIIRHQIAGSMLYMLPSKYAWPPRISMRRQGSFFFIWEILLVTAFNCTALHKHRRWISHCSRLYKSCD